jgi:hypothetical protein
MSRVAAEPVEEHRAVVVLLFVRDLALAGKAGVVEPGSIGEPCYVGSAGVGDSLTVDVAGRDIDHAQHALLRAVLGEAVGEQGAVFAGIPPVQRGGPLGVQRVGIEQHAVGAAAALAHVEHGLILASVPPLVEVPTAHRHRRAERADREQLRKAGPDGGPLRRRREPAFGERVLCFGPGPRLGAGAVLEPAIRIGYALAEELVHHAGHRRNGIAEYVSHPG